MSPTATDVDVDVIEQLDFEIACELELEGCTRTAVVYVICRTCNASAPHCLECLARIKRDWAEWKSDFTGIATIGCSLCRAFTSGDMEDVWRIVPIKGGA